jgi:hypothetical protein
MYEVTTELKVVKQTSKFKLNSMTTHLSEVRTSDPSGGAIRVTIENNTDYYIQAQADRDAIGGASVRSHPTICGASLGSMQVDFQPKGSDGGMVSGQSTFFVPRDLPPWTRIEMEIGSDQFSPLPCKDRCFLIRPQFAGVGSQLVNASEQADLHISSVLLSPVAASDGSRKGGNARNATLVR